MDGWMDGHPICGGCFCCCRVCVCVCVCLKQTRHSCGLVLLSHCLVGKGFLCVCVCVCVCKSVRVYQV